ncbi:hypothetical protein [Yinghuangia soli]|uniref:Lipoprotein n=1 Tax=Yinghuangia soli TaxID=2908204 RepID=A0AA41U1C5_9ACTN|nr:hypothetical protein [Yinghuangia soli]MCF2529486.1 hypothetical protein [Yinghuangia soli]
MKTDRIRRSITALAAAAALAAGLAGCDGGNDGDKSQGSASSPGAGSGPGPARPPGQDDVQTDPRITAYADRLLAFLKTTSQGSHALRAEIFKEKGKLFANVDTDLPYFRSDDMSSAASDSRGRRDKLAAEAEDWAYANPEVRIELIAVYMTGRGEKLRDAGMGHVRKRDAEDTKRNAYNDRVLAHLKTTEYAALVTRVEIDKIVDEAEVSINTTLPPYDLFDFSEPARQTRAQADGIAAAVLAWTATATEYNVTSVRVEDREKGTSTLALR